MNRKRFFTQLLFLSFTMYVFSQKYQGKVELGYVFNASGANQERVELSSVHGLAVSNTFVGIGMQLDLLTNKNVGSDNYAVPLFLDFTWQPRSSNKCIPIADVRGGYSVMGNTGHYVNFSIGIQYALAKASKLTFLLGLEYQRFNYNKHDEWDLNNGPMAKVGYVF